MAGGTSYKNARALAHHVLALAHENDDVVALYRHSANRMQCALKDTRSFRGLINDRPGAVVGFYNKDSSIDEIFEDIEFCRKKMDNVEKMRKELSDEA